MTADHLAAELGAQYRLRDLGQRRRRLHSVLVDVQIDIEAPRLREREQPIQPRIQDAAILIFAETEGNASQAPTRVRNDVEDQKGAIERLDTAAIATDRRSGRHDATRLQPAIDQKALPTSIFFQQSATRPLSSNGFSHDRGHFH